MESEELELVIDFDTNDKNLKIVERISQFIITRKNSGLMGYEENGKIVVPGKGYDPDFDYPIFEQPELRPLADKFDRILILSDAFHFTVFCIKNNLAGNNKVSITAEEFVEIGKDCLKFTGSLNLSKLPVVFKVVEVANEQDNDTSHIRSLKRIPGLKKVAVHAYQLNLSNHRVWSNLFLNGLFDYKSIFQEAIQIAESDNDISYEDVQVRTDNSPAYLTYGFILVFVAIFILELFNSNSYVSPDIKTLVSFGGLNINLFNEGQTYRLFTSPFIHGGYIHLFLNCIAFFFGGYIVETFLNRSWLVIIFMLSALAGGVASLILSPSHAVSVGASGGIMGILAASIMLAERLPTSFEKSKIQLNLMYILIPSVLPIFYSSTSDGIDYAAHLGGFIFGAIISCFVYFIWPKKSSEPKLGKFSSVLAITAIALTTNAGFTAYKNQKSDTKAVH